MEDDNPKCIESFNLGLKTAIDLIDDAFLHGERDLRQLRYWLVKLQKGEIGNAHN